MRALDHAPTGLCIAAERGALDALEGSCRTALGSYAVLKDGRLDLIVEALTPDGRERFRRQGSILNPDRATAAALGHGFGLDIQAEAGDRLLLKE